jgi:hypothetical protein
MVRRRSTVRFRKGAPAQRPSPLLPKRRWGRSRGKFGEFPQAARPRLPGIIAPPCSLVWQPDGRGVWLDPAGPRLSAWQSIATEHRAQPHGQPTVLLGLRRQTRNTPREPGSGASNQCPAVSGCGYVDGMRTSYAWQRLLDSAGATRWAANLPGWVFRMIAGQPAGRPTAGTVSHADVRLLLTAPSEARNCRDE